MTKEIPIHPTTSAKTTTLLETAVLNMVARFLEQKGVEAARKKLDELNEGFSREEDWPVIIVKADKLIDNEVKRLKKIADEHQQKIEEKWIEALGNGVKVAQANLLTGMNAQSLYNTSTPPIPPIQPINEPKHE